MKINNPVRKTVDGLSGSLIPGKELKIFIVDDDEFFLKLISSCLAKFSDFTLFEFSDYRDCLESTVKPDVVIIDYYISSRSNDNTNGVKLLAELRKKYPNIINVVLSGKAELKDENDELKELLEKDFVQFKKRFRDGAYFYFFKNKNACLDIFDILAKISWKSAGE